MQRNRSQVQSTSQATVSAMVTRSRSASASSRTSNSGSSSSESSSSGSSSSSSSSGSDSDSSSSDTEASRASSRNSRASGSSQKNKANNSVTPTKKAAGQKTGAGGNKKTGPQSPAMPTPAPKARLSGTVTNTKTVPRSKAVVRNVRRKSLAASSSESESVIEPSPVIKKVGSKPPSKVISVKKPPPVTGKTPPKKKPAGAAGGATAAAKAAPKKPPTTSTAAAKNTSVQKKLMKSIFSPDNSSEESDGDSKVKPVEKVKAKTSTPPIRTTTTGKTPRKPPPPKRVNTVGSKEEKKKKGLTPITPAQVATSTSASSASSASSSCSSSDSSSDSEKKNESVNNEDSSGNKKESSPASGSHKRPVTRRQRGAVKSRTINTTTTFNQSALTKAQSQNIAPWDSDFSDEPKSLARVPAKTNLKSRKITEEDEEMLEREKKCPFPCCDSQGHLSGQFPTHSMLATCPKYHGFTPEECKENADERSKRESERKKYHVPNVPHHKKPTKLSQDAKNWVNKIKELKAHDTADGLCTQYDLSLWNDSLALAAARVEQEQGEGLGLRSVAMGRWEMSCWCESPYPEPLCQCRRLFICEFCLKPVQSGTVLRRHCAKCVWRHPPGDEIYRKERLSVWEVDGKSQKTYCQNLCLLAKCFLDHKTLYLDVDPFLFYVMTLADSTGCHIVGYFSKEKNSFLNYNVSCILTLPPYQRQGFGRLLIEFSYLLTRVEGKVGSPEKPLSDLGLISYRSYWKDAVLRRLCACASREMNVKDLSIELGVTSADLISTLQFLGMLKYWKGKHLVLKKQDVLEDYLERVRRRGEQRTIDSSCLRWRPYQPPPETQN